MKIFEIHLKDANGKSLYKSLVPEIHVLDKVNTLIQMNDVSDIGGLFFMEVGDISDRYIQTYMKKLADEKKDK